MRKVLSVVLVGAIALSPIPMSNASTIKAGAPCSKVGLKQTQKKTTFTCVRVKGKLLWNSGVAVKSNSINQPKPSSSIAPPATTSTAPSPTAKPSTSSTPSPSATKIPITRREKALAEVRRVYEANAGKPSNLSVKYIISNDAPTKFVSMLKEVIPVTARFWADVFTPEENYPIIIGNSTEVAWVQNEMKKYGHNLTSWDIDTIKKAGPLSSRGDARTNERSTITQYVIGDKQSEGIPNNLYMMRSFVSHEYVHTVAISILGDRHEGIPGWSVEGSANFFGFAVTSLMNENPESAMEKVNKSNLERPAFEGGLVPHTLNKDDLHAAIVLSEEGGGGDGTTCAEPKILCYTAGALMTEILIADHGFDKFVSWWKATKTKNWEVAFEDIYGYQIDQWYEDVAVPYIIAESKAAVPRIATASSSTATKKFPARPSRTFIPPGYKSSDSLSAIKAFEAVANSSSKEPNITYRSSANANNGFLTDIKKYFNATLKYFSSYADAQIPVNVIFANSADIDWFISEISKIDPSISESEKSSIRSQVSQWGDYSGFRFIDGKAYIELAFSNSRLINFKDNYRAYNLSGYAAQSLQNTLTGNKPGILPCWVRKGTQSFFGLVSARQTDALDYYIERPIIVGDWYTRRSQYNFQNFTTNDWQNFQPKFASTQGCEKDSFVTPIGMLLTELQVSQFGIDKIINWWSLAKTNNDWKANFTQTFGTDFDTWYRQYGIPYLTEQMAKFKPLRWMK